MTIDEFLAAIQEKIVADRVFDPIAVTQDRLGVIASYLGTDERAIRRSGVTQLL